MTLPQQKGIDRLQLAWGKLREAVNLTIPDYVSRLVALRRKLTNDRPGGQ